MDVKEAYQALALGAKMQGIMESFTQEGTVITARKNMCQKEKKM